MDLESIRRELVKLAEMTNNEAIKLALAEVEEKIRLNPEYVPF